MKKAIFTAVFMTAGFVFTSAQHTGAKTAKDQKSQKRATSEVATKNSQVQASQTAKIKMTDPNVKPQKDLDALKRAESNAITEPKKAEMARKK